jgi:hypothetical protein
VGAVAIRDTVLSFSNISMECSDQQTCFDPRILDHAFLKGRHNRYPVAYTDTTGGEVGIVVCFEVFWIQFRLQRIVKLNDPLGSAYSPVTIFSARGLPFP